MAVNESLRDVSTQGVRTSAEGDHGQQARPKKQMHLDNLQF